MFWKVTGQLPKILRGIGKEHRLLQRVIRENRIDAVISDNRFGMWNCRVHSVYITHQLNIKAPEGWQFAEPLLHFMHRHFWKNYRECWIPDFPGSPNLSGNLGHPRKVPPGCHYIGPLSRFAQLSEIHKDAASGQPDLLVLLSGPEPQRSIFEKLVLTQLSGIPSITVVIVRGLPGNTERLDMPSGVTFHSHLPDGELASLIRSARGIICRPGYSTLMDLWALGRGAVLVPTPGQTEQEYLAKHHSRGGYFVSMSQADFNLEQALKQAIGLPTPSFPEDPQHYLDTRISSLLEQIRNENR
jgi:UDP-N-acetylglucosamine transferase subunit ALG13